MMFTPIEGSETRLDNCYVICYTSNYQGGLAWLVEKTLWIRCTLQYGKPASFAARSHLCQHRERRYESIDTGVDTDGVQ